MRWLFGAAALTLTISCSEESRRCRSERDRAQEIVKAMDTKSIDGLRGAVTALTSAIDACDKAKMLSDKGQLVEARNQIDAHVKLLEKKAKRKRERLTPEEIEKLEKEGDPSCPKGQGYKLAGAKEIRCTGPQLVDMGMDAAEEYFSSRKYKLKKTESPPQLRAEQGAELYVFTYDKPDDTAGPKCLELYPIPGIPLVEAVGRASGARLEKIKNGGSLETERGELAIKLEESDKKMVAKIGSCGG